MINPLLKTLNQNQLTPIKNLMNTVKAAQNPSAMLNQMMAQNPQLKQAMDYVNQNGGDAKTAFYKLAEQQGVNPSDIINLLK